jgi:hypothetical protein
MGVSGIVRDRLEMNSKQIVIVLFLAIFKKLCVELGQVFLNELLP